LISAANDKPKKFYSKIDEAFAQIDEEIPARVAAKPVAIRLYNESRLGQPAQLYANF